MEMSLDSLVINNGKIDTQLPLPDGSKIRYRAENIGKTRTGTHAKMMIGVNQTLLAYSYFNIERDEERVRLSGSAHRHMSDTLKQLYSKEQIKHDLDVFSTLIWQKWVEFLKPSLVVGNAERSAPEFNLTPYILDGGGTILFGPPERMKTMTALTWAVCVDSGLNYPFQVRKAPVLYVNLERPDGSMQRRLGDINRALGLDADRPILMLNARGSNLPDIEDGIAKAVDEYGVRVGFLDSISRAGYGDLIDNRVANQTIDIMNRLFPSWVGIAHSPRNDSTHMFGSMHFEAGADIIVQLLTETQGDKTGVGFQVVKANDMKKPPLGFCGFEFDEYGVTKIWRPALTEFPEISTVQAKTIGLTEEIRLYLLGNGDADALDIANDTGKSRGAVAKLLAASPLFTVTRKEGKKLYYGVKV